MPFSQSSQISSIVRFMESEQPASILDVGAGMGQYGFLARTNLENINLFEFLDEKTARKRSREGWNIRIDCIEGFAEYITPVHEYAYNRILIGDALELLPQIDRKYELVMAIDILEHFDKETGRRFIDLLKQVCSGAILVSTPKDFVEQAVEANPLEDHRSHWNEEELKSEGFQQTLPNEESWVVVCRP